MDVDVGVQLRDHFGFGDYLRGALLRLARGAQFERTDLFRVDLRGAKLDVQLREQAIAMGAFVDP